ncbi:hypothetical protein D3C87_1852560 [compost metagenome]
MIVISIGFSKGSTIRKNAEIGLQPSTVAASSISRGTDLMKPWNRKIAIGMLSPRFVIIRPAKELLTPNTLTTFRIGIIMV